MADGTSIEWARHPVSGRGATWNPILARRKDTGKLGYHCEHKSEACRFCYSENHNRRNLPGRGTGLDFKPGHRKDIEIIVHRDTLLQPLSWRESRGIFVCSMTDLFGEFVDWFMVDQVMAVACLTPQHVYFVLTKRPERARTYMSSGGRQAIVENAVQKEMARITPGRPAASLAWPPKNVWIGCSVEDQATFDARVPILLDTPAWVRWISAEPLLGPIDARAALRPRPVVRQWFGDHRAMLNWIVAGGESGQDARPSHPDWFCSLRDQCAAASVPYFFKQWGAWAPDGILDHGTRRGTLMRPDGVKANELVDIEDPDAWLDQLTSLEGDWQHFSHIGKKRAGRLLDGRTHDDMPGLVAA